MQQYQQPLYPDPQQYVVGTPQQPVIQQQYPQQMAQGPGQVEMKDENQTKDPRAPKGYYFNEIRKANAPDTLYGINPQPLFCYHCQQDIVTEVEKDWRTALKFRLIIAALILPILFSFFIILIPVIQNIKEEYYVVRIHKCRMCQNELGRTKSEWRKG